MSNSEWSKPIQSLLRSFLPTHWHTLCGTCTGAGLPVGICLVVTAYTIFCCYNWPRQSIPRVVLASVMKSYDVVKLIFYYIIRHAKMTWGIFWRVIMFGLLQRIQGAQLLFRHTLAVSGPRLIY